MFCLDDLRELQRKMVRNQDNHWSLLCARNKRLWQISVSRTNQAEDAYNTVTMRERQLSAILQAHKDDLERKRNKPLVGMDLSLRVSNLNRLNDLLEQAGRQREDCELHLKTLKMQASAAKIAWEKSKKLELRQQEKEKFNLNKKDQQQNEQVALIPYHRSRY